MPTTADAPVNQRRPVTPTAAEAAANRRPPQAPPTPPAAGAVASGARPPAPVGTAPQPATATPTATRPADPTAAGAPATADVPGRNADASEAFASLRVTAGHNICEAPTDSSPRIATRGGGAVVRVASWLVLVTVAFGSGYLTATYGGGGGGSFPALKGLAEVAADTMAVPINDSKQPTKGPTDAGVNETTVAAVAEIGEATPTAQPTVAEAREAADAAVAVAKELRLEATLTAKVATDAKEAKEAAAANTRKKRAALHASEDAEAFLTADAATKEHNAQRKSQDAVAAAAKADAAASGVDAVCQAAVEAATAAVAEKRCAADLQVNKTGNSPADELQAEAEEAETGMWALIAEWSASLATAVSAAEAEAKEVMRKPPSEMDPAFVPFTTALKEVAAKAAAMKMRVDLLKSAYDGAAAVSQEPTGDLALDATSFEGTVAEIHKKAAARASSTQMDDDYADI